MNFDRGRECLKVVFMKKTGVREDLRSEWDRLPGEDGEECGGKRGHQSLKAPAASHGKARDNEEDIPLWSTGSLQTQPGG